MTETLSEKAFHILTNVLADRYKSREIKGWLREFAVEHYYQGKDIPVAIKEGVVLTVHEIRQDHNVELRDDSGNVYIVHMPPFYFEEEEEEDA